MVPGVGGILGKLAKGLLSTMNCDEWFTGFTPAGATFSEILMNMYEEYISGSNQHEFLDIVPSYAAVDVYFNHLTKMRNTIFPTILSYIRSKTNNVLIPDTETYWTAFYRTVELYAIYYTIRKYCKLALNIPLNANTINQPMSALNPAVLADLRGLADSIQAYLEQTTGLPHALGQYLRWRFGTTFHSDNTGRPGLILYDAQATKIAYDSRTDDTPADVPTIEWHQSGTPVNVVQTIKNVFYTIQNEIAKCGRAIADIHLSYGDHYHNWDVDEAHFDEKEYNLRMNQTSADDPVGPTDRILLLLDSRLDLNAALQAVSISTSYASSENRPSRPAAGPVDQLITPITPVPKFTLVRGDAANLSDAYDYYSTIITPFIHNDWVIYLRDTSGYLGELTGGVLKPINIATNAEFSNLSPTSWYRIYKRGELKLFATMTSGTPTSTYSYGTKPQSTWWYQQLYKYCAIALQMHENKYYEVIEISGTGRPDISAGKGTTFTLHIKTNPLSYDRATITRTQLEAIQNMAIRNLVRGDYKQKSGDEKRELQKNEEKLVEVINPDVKIEMAKTQSSDKN